jgi:hypothetical protein
MRVGNLFVVFGAALVAIGLMLRFAPWNLSWFGKLTGDIRIERESTRVFIPITSMLLVSVALSVVIAVVNRVRS